MRIVIALGGNALLQRGQSMTFQNQRENIKKACQALAPLVSDHQIVITHGNGPQIGLLALQSEIYARGESVELNRELSTFDVLGAESEGMIGYMIEQECRNFFPVNTPIATLLTLVEVDSGDSAFKSPTKPIGPVYSKKQAVALSNKYGWVVARDGDQFRRVVASPKPQKILEMEAIKQLLDCNSIVICAGGGGIPTTYLEDGSLVGVEAVIDKDHVSALLAKHLTADALLLLTDVAAVQSKCGKPEAKSIKQISPSDLSSFEFETGSMGPKVESSIDFASSGAGFAGIGSLANAVSILEKKAGTLISTQYTSIAWYS